MAKKTSAGKGKPERPTMRDAAKARLLPQLRRMARADCRDTGGFEAGLLALEAAEAGDVEVLCTLLDAGVDVDFQDDIGRSLLAMAAGAGRAEAVLELIEREADVAATRDEDGFDALSAAVENGHMEIAADLIEAGATVDFDAAWVGHLEDSAPGRLAALKTLLAARKKRAKARPSSEADPRGEALLKAAGEGDLAGVKRLLKAGVPADFAGKNGETALYVAASWGRDEVVSALIAAEASLDIRAYEQSYTPLMVAALASRSDVVGRLVEAGADVGAVDSEGNTALMLALGAADHESADRLIGTGTALDVVNRRRRGALELAVENGDPERVEGLLRAGASPRGKTPEEWAGRAWRVRLTAQREYVDRYVKRLKPLRSGGMTRAEESRFWRDLDLSTTIEGLTCGDRAAILIALETIALAGPKAAEVASHVEPLASSEVPAIRKAASAVLEQVASKAKPGAKRRG